jgi:transposase
VCDVRVCGERVLESERPPWIVADSLWEWGEPLVPEVERRKRHLGRKWLDDRGALCGSLFVLHTGIRWSSCSRS